MGLQPAFGADRAASVTRRAAVVARRAAFGLENEVGSPLDFLLSAGFVVFGWQIKMLISVLEL